jgi:hypothetical protein
VILAPGSWSLDNYGQILVATVKNGATYTWDPSAIARLTVRAAVVANAPTASICSVVSDRDRHLFLMGTETVIGDPSTQDPMFIRFSNQEDINTWNPTVTNTAGTFRLDTGNEIIGVSFTANVFEVKSVPTSGTLGWNNSNSSYNYIKWWNR